MADASMRLTGNRHYNTAPYNADLIDATSFAFFMQIRVNAIPGSNMDFFWVNDGSLGSNWHLRLAWAGTNPVVPKFYAVYNDGASSFELLISGSAAAFSGGQANITLTYRARLNAGAWEYALTCNGSRTLYSGTDIWTPSGYANFGRLAIPDTRLEIGDNWGVADVSYDNFTIWKDYVPSDSDDLDMHLGLIDIATHHAADQLFRMTCDGTIGATCLIGDPGMANVGGHADAASFAAGSFSDGVLGSTGTATYDDPLSAAETLALEFHIPYGGESMGVRIKPADPGDSYTPMGTYDIPYDATLPSDFSIKVNGGSAVPCPNVLYLRQAGPRWIDVPLLAPAGPLLTPISGSDTVTVTAAKGILRGLVNGSIGITPAYADEPVTNHAGDETSIVCALPPPEERTLKIGFGISDQRRIDPNHKQEAAWYWVGPITSRDADGEPLTSSGDITLWLMPGFPRQLGWAWQCSESAATPGKEYSLPLFKPGRARLEYFGDFNWSGGTPDQIIDEGIYNPGITFAIDEKHTQPVSWWTFDNFTYSNGTGEGGRHVVEFDCTLAEGNVGHACVGSVGGDDFVRVSRSPWTKISWVAKGGGARTGIKFYPPGNYGLTYDYTTKEIANRVDPKIIRLINLLSPPSFDSFPAKEGLRRFGPEKGKTFLEYPTYNPAYTMNVTSVANYTGGSWYANLIPSTHRGTIIEITFDGPHPYTENCLVWVQGGVARIPINDNGGSNPADVDYNTSGMPWNNESMIVYPHPSDNTKVIAAFLWNKGLSANFTIAATVTSGLGTLNIPWPNNRHDPELALQFVASTNAAAWVHVPIGFNQAATADYADWIAARWPTGRDLYVENCNEIWNFFFAGWQSLYSLQYTLPGTGAAFAATISGGALTGGTVTTPGSGYFFGEDGWYELSVSGDGTGGRLAGHFVGGVATSVSVIAAGSGYTSATLALPTNNTLTMQTPGGLPAMQCIWTRRLRRIFRQAWSDAGKDPNNIKPVFSGQGENAGYMQQMIDYCKIAGWTPETICPAIYDNFDAGNNVLAAGWNDGTLYKDYTKRQVQANMEYQIAWANLGESIQITRAHMDDQGFSAVPIVTYEGSWECVLPGNIQKTIGLSYPGDFTDTVRSNLGADFTLGWSAVNDPHTVRLQYAWLKHYQDSGVAIFTHYQCGGDAVGDGARGLQQWDSCFGLWMLPGKGDGSDSQFDNRGHELEYPNIVSPTYHAFAVWNGTGLDPDSVPPPTGHGTRGLKSRPFPRGPR